MTNSESNLLNGSEDFVGADFNSNEIVNQPQGLLVAPGFEAKAVDALVKWNNDNKEMVIQSLKLTRFVAPGKSDYFVFLDDFYVVRPHEKRRFVTWDDLRAQELVSEESVFVLSVKGGEYSFEATPSWSGGRGRNLFLADKHRSDALKKKDDTIELIGERNWETNPIRDTVSRLQQGEGVPMSNLTLYLQRAFNSDVKGEPTWQVPSQLWRLKGTNSTIADLDDKFKKFKKGKT